MVKNDAGVDSPPPVAFVAMCFDGRLQHVYHKVVKPVLEDHGFLCRRADEIFVTGVIIDQIRDAIGEASLVLCDLTYENPNVFYELGVAHVLDRPTVMISQSAANIPFDVRHLRVIQYEDTKLGLLDFRHQLAGFMKAFSTGREPYTHRTQRDVTVPPDEIELQRAALFSNSRDFKRYAIKFVGDYQDDASFQKVLQIAVTDGDVDVVRDAFTALHKIDSDKARSLLLKAGLRYQGHYLVRERVVSLLKSYARDAELLGAMKEQLGDSSWGVRRAVCEVLGHWCESTAVGPLERMLSDPEPAVRLAAAEALERLRDAEAQEARESPEHKAAERAALVGRDDAVQETEPSPEPKARKGVSVLMSKLPGGPRPN